MQTLYLAGAATLVACIIGIPLGIWASRRDPVEAVVVPVIDTLQTIPMFCIIIPVVMLFRVGDVNMICAQAKKFSIPDEFLCCSQN